LTSLSRPGNLQKPEIPCKTRWATDSPRHRHGYCLCLREFEGRNLPNTAQYCPTVSTARGSLALLPKQEGVGSSHFVPFRPNSFRRKLNQIILPATIVLPGGRTTMTRGSCFRMPRIRGKTWMSKGSFGFLNTVQVLGAASPGLRQIASFCVTGSPCLGHDLCPCLRRQRGGICRMLLNCVESTVVVLIRLATLSSGWLALVAGRGAGRRCGHHVVPQLFGAAIARPTSRKITASTRSWWSLPKQSSHNA
jgi:hypothetical protein